MRSALSALQQVGLACLIFLATPVHADTKRAPDAVTVDGARYFGPLRAGKLRGRGRLEWENGNRYEGEFDRGMMSGNGKLTSTSGFTYEGEFKSGQFSGKGDATFDDGRKYRGEFARSKFHGKGRHENAAGEVYEGDFEQSEFTGSGTYTRPDGTRHVGRFEKWRPHGRGTFTDPRGIEYEGEFVHGELVGTGKMTVKGGPRYEGEFKNWRFHGQGVLHLTNGDVYRGGFAHGAYDGEGRLRYAKARADGSIEERGPWRFGQREGAEKDQQTQLNVERSLFVQRPLLDSALAAIKPSDPARINMYLLAIAGDGTQEVFRREVQFVRDEFDRKFGTQGRSIALINSRTAVESAPMATITSIGEALKTIARRMDRERDILFLFLTSHGSKDHQFVLGQNGMDLRDLPAKDLGALIKESGIRWKVIVVSACYAGGFIDTLKDDRTLIITAARHDRKSFGCADDNDFTHFGRAFFKDALADSKTFEEAFSKAELLVKEREISDLKGEDGKIADEHSMPQIHSTPAIRDHLQRWRAQVFAHDSLISPINAPRRRTSNDRARDPRPCSQNSACP